ncbi:zf-DHHC-domain-containing protein [Mycena alexandri]|uniref:Palmitoyltransferase PFA4 n=1 Tax=Mycena alexandri TaxID=1745969 RepID=A0AAD6T5S6_9AGAR|nr:zf-DHHC-domain-containing protein [Mycena alexandri]
MGALGWIVVNIVLLLICFIAYSSQIFIIWPWYGREVSVQLISLLLPFNLLVGMLLWNYFLCVTTDPGRVPETWKPDTHSDGYEVKKLTGGPRYCRMCERPKPPRTHHCRSCGRCVLRMDHHCPWINNCVGHFNHGHFIRFLFYVDLACLYHVVMVTRRVFYSMESRYYIEPDGVELVFLIMNYVACVPVLMSVGAFSLYHFSSLMSNTTTIEGWEKDKVATMVRKGKIREVKFPYNIGRRRNIESVLGQNPWLWCWPTTTPGTGLKYQLTEGDDSPWTYENGSVNPELQASNSSAPRRRKNGNGNGASALPPYHPDYQAGGGNADEYDTDDDDDEYRYTENSKMRPGISLKLEKQPQRYHRYIPEPESESESDDVPLGQRLPPH